jgi:hypothetical protein
VLEELSALHSFVVERDGSATRLRALKKLGSCEVVPAAILAFSRW